MRNIKPLDRSPSALEQLVLDFLAANGPASSETIRAGLRQRHAMKEATARTVLRRLEAKGYVTHQEDGRTYIYSCVQPRSLAMRTVRQIIERFWGGSAQALVTGMVEDEVIDPSELRKLSRKLERLERQPKKGKGK